MHAMIVWPCECGTSQRTCHLLCRAQLLGATACAAPLRRQQHGDCAVCARRVHVVCSTLASARQQPCARAQSTCALPPGTACRTGGRCHVQPVPFAAAATCFERLWSLGRANWGSCTPMPGVERIALAFIMPVPRHIAPSGIPVCVAATAVAVAPVC